MIRDIEFVCIGNNGRSPVAEATAKRLIKTLGLEDQVSISSSGTDVQSNGDLRTIFRPFVEKAVYRQILDKEMLEEFEKNPQGVFDQIVSYEKGLRDQYLKDSLREPFEHTPRQTIIRPKAELILPIDGRASERVRSIYAGSVYSPKIEQLGEYSGLGLELKGSFPSTEIEYRKTAAQVETATRAAILKAISSLI